MKIRSCEITGDECPAGTLAFQITFLSGAISTGSLALDALTPVPCGPRNCGQSSAAASEVRSSDVTRVKYCAARRPTQEHQTRSPDIKLLPFSKTRSMAHPPFIRGGRGGTHTLDFRCTNY